MKHNINSCCAANKVDLLAYAVLCSAVVLTYFNCLGHDFVFWDDPIYIVYNEATRGGKEGRCLLVC
jgi:hypothetical protein